MRCETYDIKRHVLPLGDVFCFRDNTASNVTDMLPANRIAV